jgi:hypothetical protein
MAEKLVLCNCTTKPLTGFGLRVYIFREIGKGSLNKGLSANQNPHFNPETGGVFRFKSCARAQCSAKRIKEISETDGPIAASKH